MFESKRDRAAVLVLAALLFAAQLGEERSAAAPEARLVRFVEQAHVQAHVLVDRAYSWVGSVLVGVSGRCSFKARTLSVRCNAD